MSSRKVAVPIVTRQQMNELPAWTFTLKAGLRSLSLISELFRREISENTEPGGSRYIQGSGPPILMLPTKNCLQPWVVDKRQIKCRLIFAISHTSNIGLNTFLTRSHKINCLPALFFKYGYIRNERPYAESTHRFRFELSTRTGRSKDVRDLQ